MTLQAGCERLECSLNRDESGRYRFACPKASLFIRLLDGRKPMRFRASDGVAFRFSALEFIVEDVRTSRVRYHFPLENVESLAAGEPETDSGNLFQG